jgi:ribonuclease III
MDESKLQRLQGALGHCFKDPALLLLAVTHASIADARHESNERMEFLGDAVLGMVVSERVYRRFPDLLEGELTKIKSAAVSRQTCAAIAQQLGLDEYLVLGKGMQGQHDLPQSLGSAALEAVIAAIYLDGGFEAARAFIEPLIDPLLDRAAECGHQENFKSVLQQHAQQNLAETPLYRVLDEKGPDHAKAFKVAVELSGRRYEPAWGQSKKRAEQLAAQNALRELGIIAERPDGQLHVIFNGEPAEE